MKCCEDQDSGHKNGAVDAHKGKGHGSHLWMMVLCCGAPVVLLLLLPLLGSRFSILGLGILPFICPLMMLFMMPMMFRKDKAKVDHHQHSENAPPEIEGPK